MKGFKTIKITETFTPIEKGAPSFPSEEWVVSVPCGNKTCNKIFFLPEALDELDAHIHWGEKRSDNLVEQGGYMLGSVYKYPKSDQLYAIVSKLIPVVGAEGTSAYLNMGTDASYEASIAEQQAIMDSNNELRRIGWYHTHPGSLGVFMSGTDMKTQTKSYSQEWQFAVVLNPQKRIWRGFNGYKAKECECVFLCPDNFRYNKFKKHGHQYDSWSVTGADIEEPYSAAMGTVSVVPKQTDSIEKVEEVFTRINSETIYIGNCTIAVSTFVEMLLELVEIDGDIECVQNIAMTLEIGVSENEGLIKLTSAACTKQFINVTETSQINIEFSTIQKQSCVDVRLQVYSDITLDEFSAIVDRAVLKSDHSLLCVIGYADEITYYICDKDKNIATGAIKQ